MGELLARVIDDLTRPLETAGGIVSVALTMIGVILIVVGSFMRTMVNLRAVTAMSNLFLLAGAIGAPHAGLVVLYLILFPLNCVRLAEIMRLTRRVRAATLGSDLSDLWLKPYMKARRLRAGTIIFHQGDPADALFLLVDGDLEWIEIGVRQPPGQLFGEISFFSADRKRTMTGRCLTDCLVMRISADAFRELYFQNPRFAFHISELIAQRLIADLRQVQKQLASPPPLSRGS